MSANINPPKGYYIYNKESNRPVLYVKQGRKTRYVSTHLSIADAVACAIHHQQTGQKILASGTPGSPPLVARSSGAWVSKSGWRAWGRTPGVKGRTHLGLFPTEESAHAAGLVWEETGEIMGTPRRAKKERKPIAPRERRARAPRSAKPAPVRNVRDTAPHVDRIALMKQALYRLEGRIA